MAQIPRSLSATAPTNISAGRLQGGPRSVASSDATPVEAANAQDGVLFNDALLFQDDQSPDRRSRENAQGNHLVEYAGSSQTFASIFEEATATGRGGGGQRAQTKGIANLFARAINVYETNVRVIQGVAEPRGSHLSLTL